MDAINKSLTGKAVAPLPDSAESLEDYVFRAWSLLTEELADEPALALEIELEFELENQAEAYPGFDAPLGRGEAPYREIVEMHAESRISLTEDCIESMSVFEPEPPVEFQADEPISLTLDDDAGDMTALPQAPLILRFADAPLRIAPTPVLTAPVSVPVSAPVPVPAPVAASAIRSTATEGVVAGPVAQSRDRESKPARLADPMRRNPVQTIVARADSLPVTSGMTTEVTTAVTTAANHNVQSGAGVGGSSNRSSGRALSHKPSAEPAAQIRPRNPQAATTATTATIPTTPTFAPDVALDAASAQPIDALHMPSTDIDSTDVDIRPAATPYETKKALLPQAVFDALPIVQPMPERLIPALPNAPAPMQGNPQSNLQNSPQSSRQTDVASSDGAALPASAGDAAAAVADGGSTLGSTLIYRFDKWGDGHAVTVRSQAQAQAETPHYTLLPSDSVVGQRLSEQLALAAGAADMPMMSMPLTLKEDADERDRQRRPLPLHNEEDEEDA